MSTEWCLEGVVRCVTRPVHLLSLHLFFFTSCACPSLAQDHGPSNQEYSLAPHQPREGDRVRVFDTLHQGLDLKYTGRGRTMKRQKILEYETEFLEEILEVDSGGDVVRAVRVYDLLRYKDSKHDVTLRDYRVELRRLPSGSYKFSAPEGGDTPEAVISLLEVQGKPVCALEGGLLVPQRSVKLGESWKISRAEVAKALQHEESDLSNRKYRAEGTLRSAHQIAGRSRLSYSLRFGLLLSRYRPLEQQVNLLGPVEYEAEFEWKHGGPDSPERVLFQTSSYSGRGTGTGRAEDVVVDFSAVVERKLVIRRDSPSSEGPSLEDEVVSGHGSPLVAKRFFCLANAPGAEWIWLRDGEETETRADYYCWSQSGPILHLGLERLANRAIGRLSRERAEDSAESFRRGLEDVGSDATLESLESAEFPILGGTFRATFAVRDPNGADAPKVLFVYLAVTEKAVAVTLSAFGVDGKEPMELRILARSLRQP